MKPRLAKELKMLAIATLVGMVMVGAIAVIKAPQKNAGFAGKTTNVSNVGVPQSSSSQPPVPVVYEALTGDVHHIAENFRARMRSDGICEIIANNIDKIADQPYDENIRYQQIKGLFGTAMNSGCI